MTGYKAKNERTLKKEDLAGYLRELADAFEGDDFLGFDFNLACFEKVDMSLKVSGEQVYVHIKARNYGDSGEGGEAGQVLFSSQEREISSEVVKKATSYKMLKKDMKESFKLIFRAIHQDVLPSAESVESFFKDAEEMVAHSGKGDEYYPRFLEACTDLSEAFFEKNMPRLRLLVDDINHMKTECHTRYK